MKITSTNYTEVKSKMLNWANQFNIFCFLDNNGFEDDKTNFECLLAVGCTRTFLFENNNSFNELQKFHQQKPSWLFGHLGYNAGNFAYSQQKETTGFGNGLFFEPQYILQIKGRVLSVLQQPVNVIDALQQIEEVDVDEPKNRNAVNIHATQSRQQYVESINSIKQHLHRGDCYEINYCKKFIAENCSINPVQTYLDLIAISPTPFSALYKNNENYCICASPERYLKKLGNKVISQPIKGTAKRGSSAQEDEQNKIALLQSAKERSENVMVVDLVRNDLSTVCKKASVKVTELFGIYSFSQVHQMISTIEGELEDSNNFAQVLQACYPMGSMTGAPKQRVMQLIEQYENYERGLFSGSIGYITPNADFDFNVLIRSIFYNGLKNNLHFFVGSGITAYCNAEDEYDECMVKASAIMQVLQKVNP
jgi:para-aminobenzoate synthetase component I